MHAICYLFGGWVEKVMRNMKEKGKEKGKKRVRKDKR
jgi:hypothetical protein